MSDELPAQSKFRRSEDREAWLVVRASSEAVCPALIQNGGAPASFTASLAEVRSRSLAASATEPSV